VDQLGAAPKIVSISWGRIEVEGLGVGKDYKLYPGGGSEWDWSQTGTRHSPGIQPADVEELLAHGVRPWCSPAAWTSSCRSTGHHGVPGEAGCRGARPGDPRRCQDLQRVGGASSGRRPVPLHLLTALSAAEADALWQPLTALLVKARLGAVRASGDADGAPQCRAVPAKSGDIDAVKAALAPGLRWHEAGNAGVMGWEAVLQQMSRAVKRIDGYVAVHDVLANDEHVLALINVALRKPDGSEIATPPSRSPTSATGSSPSDGASWTHVLPM
jgi:hypothetical protein